MASVFSKLVNGELPCFKIAETEDCLAFLDIFPLTRGHVLCIPKTEVDCLFDLEEELYNELFKFSQSVAKAIQKTIPSKRIGMLVAGFDVPHAHIHLIPINSINDMNFLNQKLTITKEELQSIAKAINMNF